MGAIRTQLSLTVTICETFFGWCFSPAKLTCNCTPQITLSVHISTPFYMHYQISGKMNPNGSRKIIYFWSWIEDSHEPWCTHYLQSIIKWRSLSNVQDTSLELEQLLLCCYRWKICVTECIYATGLIVFVQILMKIILFLSAPLATY